MDEVNPVIIALMFFLRCLVPLAIMLGISYLLRRYGLITAPPPPPKELDNGNNNQNLPARKEV
ncbi:MAG TPA: hypothetical protein VIK64_14280 [Anaerolineales bacterium]|jgi:hypothetical protein